MKVCTRCQEEKPLTEYHHFMTRQGERPRGRCKVCIRARARELINLDPEKHRSKKREYTRRYNLRKNFGIDPDEYDSLLADQDYACAICKSTPEGRRLAVDHDHNTGRIRGLLCLACNTGIGKLGDDEAGLLRALEYLRNA